MDQYIGKMLDNRYEILEVIGTGGMAVVYKARCHRLNRLVAVKILRDDLARDAEFRRRFHDESQAVAMLSHPNIMAVYDVSRSSEVEYIVMELIDGITLKQFMQKKGMALNWKETLHFITQIMKALSHAHSRGIIHRDIKPQNIMVLRDGSIKVTDFGIARLASAAQNTLTQEALGSVHYISPEQARGSRIDARSDIYSAGVVLYEMLTGRLPFEGDTPVSVAIQHINSIPLPPRELNSDIPEALEIITMKAMAPNVENRYLNADAMLTDLEEFRKNPSISFEYTPADLFTSAGITDEPTQVLETSRRKTVSHSPSPREHRRSEPEYDEMEDRRERQRRSRGGGMSVPLAVASILIFIIGIGVLLWLVFFSSIFTSETRYTVPSLSGLTVEQARSDPNVTGIFTIIEGETVTSKTYPAGQIITQEPEARRQVGENERTITVTVSAGAELITMPDLYNQNGLSARSDLHNLGVPNTNITTTYEPSDVITENFVIRTVPVAGDVILPETKVEIVVSKGPEKKIRTMLYVEGKLLDEAKKMLEGPDGLNLVVNSTTIDSDKPEGTVLLQSIPAGQEVEEGTTVTLQVSNGVGIPATPTPEPDISAPPVPEEPTVTPTPPVVTPDPDIKSINVDVRLPSEGDSSDTVEVQLRGSGYDQTQSVQRLVGSVVFSVSGKGRQKFDIYFDGVYSTSVEVNFETGDVKFG